LTRQVQIDSVQIDIAPLRLHRGEELLMHLLAHRPIVRELLGAVL
jgi:hypothetical protein